MARESGCVAREAKCVSWKAMVSGSPGETWQIVARRKNVSSGHNLLCLFLASIVE